MVGIFEVNANELIEKAAIELSRNPEITPPEWALYVKTGVGKERAPHREDWWFIRSAAVLRTVYKRGPIGVSKLSIKFGSKNNRGVRKSRFIRSSRSILRHVLQQLEKAGYVKYQKNGKYKGRIVTPEGQSLLDRIAITIAKNEEKSEPLKKKPVPAASADADTKPAKTKEVSESKPQVKNAPEKIDEKEKDQNGKK